MGRREDDRSPPSSVSGDSDSASGEGEWLDVESDEESLTFVSLLDAQTFPSAQAMLNHCRDQHGFDLAATLRRLHLDFYGAIRLVNFVRQTVQKGEALPAEIVPSHFADEAYLKPVLDNDALIFTLDEILDDEHVQGNGGAGVDEPAPEAGRSSTSVAPEAASSSKDAAASETSLEARNKALEAEVAALREQYANYRLAVEQTLDRRWGTDAADPGPTTVTPKKDNSDYYFESYAAHGRSSSTGPGASPASPEPYTDYRAV
jgi:protein arginine N-methyltransferase 3